VREFGCPPLVARARDLGFYVNLVTSGVGLDERSQVRPGQRLTSGEVQLQHAELPSLLQHAEPLLQPQLCCLRDNHGVGAVRAMQWAAVGQLGEQTERPIHCWSPADLARSGPAAAT
jgi:hypothetical protein